MSQDIFTEVGLRKGMNVSGLAKLNFVIYLFLYWHFLFLSMSLFFLTRTWQPCGIEITWHAGETFSSILWVYLTGSAGKEPVESITL